MASFVPLTNKWPVLFLHPKGKTSSPDARAGWIRSVITISLLRTLLIRVGVEVVGVGVDVPVIADGGIASRCCWYWLAPGAKLPNPLVW